MRTARRFMPERDVPEELTLQYRQESAWADELRAAPAAARGRLYAEVNEVFTRNFPQGCDGSDVDLQETLMASLVGPRDVVLELGCGDGALLRRLAPRVARYVGVEAAVREPLERELPANAELIAAPLPPYRLPDESVDWGYSCHVVEHLHPDDLHEVAREMFRLLKVGGHLVWVTPNRLLGPHDVSRYFTAQARGLHLREYTHGELAALLRAAGFRNIRVLAGAERAPRTRSLARYEFAERVLRRLPSRLRLMVLSAFGRRPFRPLEQVVLCAAKTSPFCSLRLEPFLHNTRGHLYNPVADLELGAKEPGSRELIGLERGSLAIEELEPELRRKLLADGWLITRDTEIACRHRLQFVSLETTSVCNQSCGFCPVSIAPRPPMVMTRQLFEDIAEQLLEFRESLRAVFLHNYNEPTTDPQLVERVRVLTEHGLPVAFNSNGSGLNRRRVDELLEVGGLSFISINLSTLDRRAYADQRGADHLERVLENLDYAGAQPLAELMEVAVLGAGDRAHRHELARIRGRLTGSRFVVKSALINNRAGILPVGMHPARPHRRLRGCDNLGSRPLQHLHITATGTCVLCCEDYSERHVVGELPRQRVREVLEGPELRQLRRWIYGLDPAPPDLLCRNCTYARF